ncbi:hypothetical protein Tco_1401075 [Tanacetum coccineum]
MIDGLITMTQCVVFNHTGFNHNLIKHDKMAEENIPAPTRSDDYFQLDEQWFTLNADLLREALEITPVNPSHPFVSPSAGEQCLTGKTSGGDKPRHPILQMLWGIVTRSNVVNFYGKSLFKGSFFTHQANLDNPTKKSTPYVIPYRRFTKLIIYYLRSKNNIHRRPESLIHVTGDDFPLGNLVVVVVRDFYKKFYNSLGSVPNRCSVV